MTTRQRLMASLRILVAAFLTGCASTQTDTYEAPGVAKLPEEQTALVKLGNEFDYWGVSGRLKLWVYQSADQLWPRTSMRVTPGTVELVVRLPRLSVAFVAEAGGTYTLYSRTVGKDEEVWIDDESHPRGGRHLLRGEIDSVWVEDSSGSVVAGEKPPGK